MTFMPWRPPGRRPATTDADAGEALRRLRGGERAAVALLYEIEAPRVYRYALALAGNPAWAADATQEAFVALALKPEAFDAGRGALGAYLAGIARHALAAQWRQALGHEPLADEPEGGEAPAAGDWAPSPEQALVRAQDGEAVWAALRRLPPAFREAVVLVDLQERPYTEAAAIAGVELNTLRTRLHRGRQRLAAWLRGDEGVTR